MLTGKKQNGACIPEIEIATATPSQLSGVGMFRVLSFLADRTNGRAYGTVLRLSSVVVCLCDVMYCG